ncbi:putative leucine-rich repeat-containing protein DDB_G0290503 [Dysidea avara]|uniref:putative leucine-rich repeat-containing protein DDB_G0290503 n=1 Tax=Dysidea avara TaxID=196820 RepID=UPI00331D7E8D
MSGVPKNERPNSPQTDSVSSITIEQYDQEYDDEELKQLLDQRPSSPDKAGEDVLSEFRSLYTETLSISTLDHDGSQEENEGEKRTKLKAIQAYVAELSQQHEMLLETMDEMEKEANKKLSILEGKLTTSLQTTRDYENKCQLLEGSVASLKSAIEEKSKEVFVLQQDLDLLLTTLAKAQSSGLVHLSGMALTSVDDSSQLDQLVVQSQEQLTHKQQELKTLQQKYAESQNQLVLTTAQLDALRSKHAQVELEQQNTVERMAVLEAELEQWQSGKKEQIIQLQSEIAAMETALQGMTENSSQYQIKLTEKEALLQKEQELQQAMQEQLGGKDARLDQLQKELAVLAAAKEQLDHLQKSQSVQLKEMEEQLTTVQHEVIQRQLCLQELEEQLQGSQGRGVVLQQKVDEYCSSVEKLEQELVNTQQKYQIAVQEAQELRRQLSGSEVDLEQQKSLLSIELSNRDVLIDQLQDEKRVLDEKYQRSCHQIQQSESNMRLLKSQLEQVQQEAANLKLKLTTAQDESGSARQEVEHCQQLIQELKEQLQASTHGEGQMKIVAKEHQTKLQDLKNQQQSLTEQVETREKMLQQLQTNFDSLQQHRNGLEQEINHRQKQVNQLQEQLLVAEESSRNLSSEVKNKHSEIEIIRKTNEEERMKLLDEIQGLQKELADASQMVSTEVKQLELRIVDLTESHKMDLQSSETMLKDHRNTIGHLEDQKSLLYSENEKLKTCLAKKEADLVHVMASSADTERTLRNSLSNKEKTVVKLQMDIEVYKAELKDAKSLSNQLKVEESSVKKQLSAKENGIKSLREELRQKDEALAKLNQQLMIKQKSLADLHVTVECHSSDLEEWQKVCQERSNEISVLQHEVTEKGEELVATRSTISDLHQQLLQQSDRNTKAMQEHREDSAKLHTTIDSLKEKLAYRDKDLSSIRKELAEVEERCRELQIVKGDLEIKVSRSQQNQSQLEQELELTNDHVSRLEAQHQEAINKTVQLEEKLRCAVLSCEELNGQYTMLQQRCTDQGTELAQARVDYKRASVELAESHSKINLVEHAAKQQQQQHTLVMEKIKYIQAEKDNEIAFLSKELTSNRQKSSLLESSIEDYQAESKRLKRELSEIEMAHQLEREKSNQLSQELLVTKSKLSMEEKSHYRVNEEFTTSLSQIDLLTEQIGVLHDQNTTTQEQCSELREEVATLREKLGHQMEERGQVDLLISQLQEQLQQSERSHNTTKKQLSAIQQDLQDHKLLSSKLQQDCTDITQHVSSWAKQQKLTNESMANKIRDQQQVILKLEADRHQLQLKNESLLLSNSKLQTKLQWSEAIHGVEKQRSTGSSPIAKLRARVDVDIISPNQEKPMPSTPTSGFLMESQYAAALKRGLTETSDEVPRISLKDNGSDSGVDSDTHRTAHDSSLDKAYWIHRAGELSMQLQQSSAYWSDKVRQLSSQLEEVSPLHQ